MRTNAMILLVAGQCMLGGCFGGIAGDQDRGELGRSSWSISDGLCPGIGGNCALDVPIAVGAAPRLAVDDVGGSLAGYTLRAEGGFSISDISVSEDPPQLRARAQATEAGTWRVHLVDDSGADFDRVTLTVRSAAALECGLQPTGGATWAMDGLEVSGSVEVPVDVDPEGDRESARLACRALDSAGSPLLSAGAIRWERIEGETLEIRSDELIASWGADARGARIPVRGVEPGLSRLRISIGAVTTELSVMVQ